MQPITKFFLTLDYQTYKNAMQLQDFVSDIGSQIIKVVGFLLKLDKNCNYFMKKLFVLIFLSLAFMGYAQDDNKYVVTYKIDYQPMKSKPKGRKTGEVILYSLPEYSVFIDKKSVQREEILKNDPDRKNALNSILGLGPPAISFIVEKKNDITILQQKLGTESVGFEEPIMDFSSWNLTDNTQEIAGYACQKTTTSFGGREWTAWFTSEIPINDGPYKFAGLPGLITKIDSEDAEYSFEMVSIRKFSENEFVPSLPKFTSVPRKKFLQLRENSGETSMRKLTTPAGSGPRISNMTQNGRPVSAEEMQRQSAAEDKDRNHLEKE